MSMVEQTLRRYSSHLTWPRSSLGGSVGRRRAASGLRAGAVADGAGGAATVEDPQSTPSPTDPSQRVAVGSGHAPIAPGRPGQLLRFQLVDKPVTRGSRG